MTRGGDGGRRTLGEWLGEVDEGQVFLEQSLETLTPIRVRQDTRRQVAAQHRTQGSTGNATLGIIGQCVEERGYDGGG